MNNNFYFTIIIPCLNEEDNLPILLTSLKKQDLKDFEIIVVDSGSTDKTKEKAEEFNNFFSHFKFVEKKCKNVSQARNLGASKATGEYLIFLDADGEVSINFLTEIKKKIDKYQVCALTVWNRSKKKNLTGKIILALLNLNMTLFQKIKPGASGTCIIIKKTVFEKIKGFNESIFFGEDFDLIQKTHKKGAKFAVFPTPYFFVSIRRFEKEGLILSLYKSIKAIIHQLFLGPVVKEIFEYEMGGQYYKKNRDLPLKQN